MARSRGRQVFWNPACNKPTAFFAFPLGIPSGDAFLSCCFLFLAGQRARARDSSARASVCRRRAARAARATGVIVTRNALFFLFFFFLSSFSAILAQQSYATVVHMAAPPSRFPCSCFLTPLHPPPPICFCFRFASGSMHVLLKRLSNWDTEHAIYSLVMSALCTNRSAKVVSALAPHLRCEALFDLSVVLIC